MYREMTFKKKYIYILISLAVIIPVLSAFKQEKNTVQNTRIIADIKPELKQELYTFRVEGFDENRKLKWILIGESADIMGEKIEVNNLKAIYYDKETTFNLLADRAVYNKNTQDIELIENIVGISSDGGRFFTDRAVWYAKDEKIVTDSYVTVRRKNMVCRGRGLVTKPKLKWVSFQKNVEVDIIPDRKIRCDGPFEIDYAKNIAIFYNNVELEDKHNKTYADKLTVFLNPESRKIEKVITEGNVKVVHRGEFEDIDKLDF